MNAYKEGSKSAARLDNACTRPAVGIRVPAAVGDFIIIRLSESAAALHALCG